MLFLFLMLALGTRIIHPKGLHIRFRENVQCREDIHVNMGRKKYIHMEIH